MPAPLRLFTVTTVILVILYALVPLMMLMDTGLVKTLINKSQPALYGNDLAFAIGAVKIFTAAVHALFIGLAVWLTASVGSFLSGQMDQ